MRRLLIAGCGYVGTMAADLFHRAGWEVEGWTRSSESATALSDKPYPVSALDVSNKDQVVAVPAVDFEAIIHCASTRGGDAESYRQVYLRGAQNLLNRFAGSKLLFTSSTSVYAQKKGEWITEESPAEPEHETGKILLEAEKLVLARGGTIARLSGIYGPGRSALLKKFLNNQAIIDPKKDRFVNQAHRDDVAAAFFLLLDRQLPPGEIYNVVDDKPIQESEFYGWLAERLSRPPPPVAKSTAKRKRGESNKRVSNAKLRALGWTPRYPTFMEGMEQSVLPSFNF